MIWIYDPHWIHSCCCCLWNIYGSHFSSSSSTFSSFSFFICFYFFSSIGSCVCACIFYAKHLCKNVLINEIYNVLCFSTGNGHYTNPYMRYVKKRTYHTSKLLCSLFKLPVLLRLSINEMQTKRTEWPFRSQ